MNKIKHDLICDKCNKPATYNIQNINYIYKITQNGDFKKIHEFEGNSNLYYCDKCYEKINN